MISHSSFFIHVLRLCGSGWHKEVTEGGRYYQRSMIPCQEQPGAVYDRLDRRTLMGNRIIRSIRILPSDKATFETEMEFRAFIQRTMPERGGYYYFPNQMMNCPKNTFVLFQYDGMIRATGVLVAREKTTVIDERGAKYGGYYLFDVPTLHYLANPIDKNTFRKACPEFIGFNQTKQIIPLRYWDTIFSLFQNISSFIILEKRLLI